MPRLPSRYLCRSRPARILTFVFLTLLICAPYLRAEPVYVRVSQVGYEAGHAPFRAYVMSKNALTGATFQVINSHGVIADSGRIGTGARPGTWGHSKRVTYIVNPINFNVPGGELYTLKMRTPTFSRRLRSTATTSSTTCRPRRHWRQPASRISTPTAVGGTRAT